MTDIYSHHDKAFKQVSAHAVLHNGDCVATIAFKFPADGADRLWAYVHWRGLPMIRGYAGGYGYDKRSAACADAMRKAVNIRDNGGLSEEFWHALAKDGGQHFDNALRDAGFTVVQVV